MKEAAPSKGKTMAINEQQARHLAEAMIAAGRSPSFVLGVISGYWGDAGSEAVLAVLEQQGNKPEASGVETSSG
jgi:hypothetical protein